MKIDIVENPFKNIQGKHRDGRFYHKLSIKFLKEGLIKQEYINNIIMNGTIYISLDLNVSKDFIYNKLYSIVIKMLLTKSLFNQLTVPKKIKSIKCYNLINKAIYDAVLLKNNHNYCCFSAKYISLYDGFIKFYGTPSLPYILYNTHFDDSYYYGKHENLILNKTFAFMDIITENKKYRFVKKNEYMKCLPEFNSNNITDVTEEFEYFLGNSNYKLVSYFKYENGDFFIPERFIC